MGWVPATTKEKRGSLPGLSSSKSTPDSGLATMNCDKDVTKNMSDGVRISRGDTPNQASLRVLAFTSAGVSNHGDDAILLASLERLARIRPGSRVTLISDGPRIDSTLDVRWLGTAQTVCRRLDRAMVAAGAAGDVEATNDLLESVQLARPGCGSWDLRSYDLVWFLGGGNLCRYWPALVRRRAAVAAAARASQVPFLVTGQGIGPLSPEVLPALRLLVTGASGFSTRDSVSRLLLRQLRIGRRVTALGDDALGWYPPAPKQWQGWCERIGLPTDRPWLGFHARQSPVVGLSMQQQRAVYRRVDRLAAQRGWVVVSLPISTQPDAGERDLMAARRFSAPRRQATWIPLDCGADVAALTHAIRRCQAVVCQSFHLGLFAARERIATVMHGETTYMRKKTVALTETTGAPCSLLGDPTDSAAELGRQIDLLRRQPWRPSVRASDCDNWFERQLNHVLAGTTEPCTSRGVPTAA